MDLSAVRSIVTCEKCGDFFESPVKLPCFNTLCQTHVVELLKKNLSAKKVIECCFCHQDHAVPPNGFESYTKLNEIIESKSHLYDEEKQLILYFDYATKKISELATSIKKTRPDTEEFVLKNLAKLKEQINQDFEKLTQKIDDKRQKLVTKIELFEDKCAQSLNEVSRISSDEFLNEISLKFDKQRRSSKFDLETIKAYIFLRLNLL